MVHVLLVVADDVTLIVEPDKSTAPVADNCPKVEVFVIVVL